ncbi:MAG: MerR family transcriptional regulator [bacterium]
MSTDDRLLTTQQAADRLGLSVSTVKRLVESNQIPAVKTPGGHRRLTFDTVEKYASERGLTTVEKTATAPASMVSTGRLRAVNESLEYWQSALKAALIQTHTEEARHAVRTVYASEGNAASLADKLISPVMRKIGHAWQDGRIEIFQEHHACHMLADILYELVRQIRSRNRRSGMEQSAPMAIGATPEGDHYTLTGMLCELCMLERGWNVRNLGCHLPMIELSQAITDLKPKIAWLSVHHLLSEPQFLIDLQRLHETAKSMKTRLVVGGMGITEKVRAELTRLGVVIGDDLECLTTLSDSIFPDGRRAIGNLAQTFQDLQNTR